jgi:protein SCO1/2
MTGRHAHHFHLRLEDAVQRYRSFAALILIAVVVAGCGKSPQTFNATDISRVDWGRGFELTDHTGQRRTLEDFRGKVVLLFFGFTNCPDVCPTALAEMSQALKRLGEDAGRVQGLLITVDPERDTEQVLAKYVTAFHSAFLGLRGTAEETERTVREFKSYSAKRETDDRGAYSVDHTSAIFMFDPQGKLRLLAGAQGRTPETLAEDIRKLLAE